MFGAVERDINCAIPGNRGIRFLTQGSLVRQGSLTGVLPQVRGRTWMDSGWWGRLFVVRIGAWFLLSNWLLSYVVYRTEQILLCASLC